MESLTLMQILGLLLVGGIAIFTLMAVNAIVAVYVERKVGGFMQDRLGPMGQGYGLHAGKWGVLQTVADALKLLLKEDIIPRAADRKLFIAAPFVLFIGAFISIAALPFNSFLQAINVNIGILYILAVSSLSVIGLILSGWSSDNKWSLYGAMRSAAQIVSYEIPAGLSVIAVVMMTGSLDMQEIIKAQAGSVLWVLPGWFVFQNPFLFMAFFIYFVAGVAESNRTPFDIPEAESELVAGFHTEYSGIRWSFFFLSEYANMFIVSGIATVVFLGGWMSPIPGLLDSPAWQLFWFISKIAFLMFVVIWFRFTFPRLRVDQLMTVSWKVLLPWALLNIFGVGIWTLIFG